jgi:hypothetical protein
MTPPLAPTRNHRVSWANPQKDWPYWTDGALSGLTVLGGTGGPAPRPRAPGILRPWCYTPAEYRPAAEQVPGTGSNGRLLCPKWNQRLRDHFYIC